MSQHLERATLLFNQSRYDLAEPELRRALGDDPDNAGAHALLAICLSRRQKHDEAVAAGEEAIQLDPAVPFTHYALAEVLYRADRNRLAERAIDTAIELDPADADYFGLRAAIRFDERDWPGALAAAEQGLDLNPEHDACTNLRAIALVKLGRKEEASATIAGALERDPESAPSHANQGWTLLHQGKPKEALVHFREALRIDPDLDWARAGMVEALKARHFVYRVMLGFFLWMGRLSAKAQWMVLLALLFLPRLLGGVAAANPALEPIITLIRVGLLGFVLLTWIADPLFNLVLRFNRFGRHALTRPQVVASNWLGGWLLVTLAVFLAALIAESQWLAYAGVNCLFLTVAVAGVLRVRAGWPRALMALAAIALCAIGQGTVFFAWLVDTCVPPQQRGFYAGYVSTGLQTFFFGLLGFTLLTTTGMSARWREDT
jgi:tetratricopeptide (TPR) repeat protein